MEWIARFNRVMDYIEEHITEKLDYEELARMADCPAYHFQKMFFYMTDLSLAEYIRRRRMSLAAVDLQSGSEKVIDVALKYGYESPTAFNRAFQSIHGVAPSQMKRKNIPLKSYPAIHFSLSVHGMEELNFRMEKKTGFRILGISCPLSKKLEENFQRIPGEWDRALSEGILVSLSALMEGEPRGLLGVSVHNDRDWKYFIAVCSERRDSSFEEYHIPAAEWAVFSGRGTNISLQNLERRVITEWLPSSGYEYARIPDIEVYQKADPEDAVYEYWLPVVKRSSREI